MKNPLSSVEAVMIGESALFLSNRPTLTFFSAAPSLPVILPMIAGSSVDSIFGNSDSLI